MGIEKIFKPHIVNSGGYKGGPAAPADSIRREIHKLSSNENVLGPAPKALKSVITTKDLNIYPNSTAQPLYDALAAHYDHVLTSEHFIAGNGGSDLLQLISRAFLDQNSNYIINDPCFAPYKMFSSWTGSQCINVPLTQPDYQLDVDGILKAITKDTRLLYLTSPNNPTGTYIQKAQLETILNKVPDHLIVVYDEVYHHFVTASDFSTGLPYVEKGHNMIALNSFSKAYGLAALRIGYGYTTPKIASYIRKLIRPFLINSVSLKAAQVALSDSSFIQSTVETITKQRGILAEGLIQLHVKQWPSQANFILIEPPFPEQKFTQLMAEQGVMVRSASNFGAPGCIRITIGDHKATQATLSAIATIA